MSLFAFSSVCFADGNGDVLNPDEQFAYDCIDKWYDFLDNSKVRFKAVDATDKDNVERIAIRGIMVKHGAPIFYY
jgi:hypothetical protein